MPYYLHGVDTKATTKNKTIKGAITMRTVTFTRNWKAAMVFGIATAILLQSQISSAAETAGVPPESESAPTALNSMDEQYAWVGDLGDRDALPGKPLYQAHCAGCH